MGVRYCEQCVCGRDVSVRTELIIVPADGVYKAGFATTQAAYEKAVHAVFESLDRLEKILQGKDYLVGNVLTEADIRLFVTIVCCLSHHFPERPHLAAYRSGLTLSTSATSSAISAPSVADIPIFTRELLHGSIVDV